MTNYATNLPPASLTCPASLTLSFPGMAVAKVGHICLQVWQQGWTASSDVYHANSNLSYFTVSLINVILIGVWKWLTLHWNVQNTHVYYLKKVLSRGLFDPVGRVTLNTHFFILGLSNKITGEHWLPKVHISRNFCQYCSPYSWHGQHGKKNLRWCSCHKCRQKSARGRCTITLVTQVRAGQVRCTTLAMQGSSLSLETEKSLCNIDSTSQCSHFATDSENPIPPELLKKWPFSPCLLTYLWGKVKD